MAQLRQAAIYEKASLLQQDLQVPPWRYSVSSATTFPAHLLCQYWAGVPHAISGGGILHYNVNFLVSWASTEGWADLPKKFYIDLIEGNSFKTIHLQNNIVFTTVNSITFSGGYADSVSVLKYKPNLIHHCLFDLLLVHKDAFHTYPSGYLGVFKKIYSLLNKGSTPRGVDPL